MTRPDKTFLDLALPDFGRQAPILLQTCLTSPHTGPQLKIFCQPTKNRLLCGGLIHKEYKVNSLQQRFKLNANVIMAKKERGQKKKESKNESN